MVNTYFTIQNIRYVMLYFLFSIFYFLFSIFYFLTYKLKLTTKN